jgi:hypothetical protein
MQKTRMLIRGTILLTVILCLLALLLPTPPGLPRGIDFHNLLVVNIIMACTHIGGALLFLTNLDVYKARLRRAYSVLSIGVLVLGMVTLQILVISILNGWTNTALAATLSSLTILLYLLSGMLLYAAVRSFARLVDVRHPLTRAWVVLPGAVILAALSSLLPHQPLPTGTPEVAFDVFVGIFIWSGSLMLFAGWLALEVRKHAGAHYVHAMAWLTGALIVSASLLLYGGIRTLLGGSDSLVLNALSYVLNVSTGLMWVRAGYAFALTKYYDEDVPLLRELFAKGDIAEQGPKTVIDMVTYAAGLVSNSHDIDPLLDDVRAITAKLNPGEDLSSNDTKRLVGVYLKLEQYLMKKEVIRTFTETELRSQLAPELQKLVRVYEK